MADKINITIDDKEISVEKDTYLLQAIEKLGIYIPTLCNHKDLTPEGSCRLCMCEIELPNGRKKLVTSCNYPIRDSIKVRTHTDKIENHRKMLAEMYLGRWPNVEIIQGIAKECGVIESRFTSELTDTNPNACVLCGRCVRACREFPLEQILDFAGQGIKRHMTMPFGGVDEHCIECRSCEYVCPTGAIKITEDRNHPHDAAMIRDAGMKINAEMATLDDKENRMRQVGTANIVDVMDQYDLLPVHNYKFGSHPDAKKIYSNVFRDNFLTQGACDGCWLGCSMACSKAAEGFLLKTGPYKGHRVTVDGPEYETAAGCANMGCFDPEFVLEFNFYCDTYGIDTISMSTTTAFVMECFENGIITTRETGGLKLNFGNTDAVLELLHQAARGEGFGVEVGQGIKYLKEKWIKELGADPNFLNDIGMEVKGLEYSEYVTKESLAQQGGYAMAVKGPQHDEAWLIFMDMVNNQLPTFEDKAEGLHYFPMWRTWFALQGLCKLPWNDIVPADNYLEDEPAKIPDHVRDYCKFFEGMTGKKVTPDDLIKQSERVYNLQRIMSYMFGKGTRENDMPPYRSMGPVTVEEYESRADRYDTQLREIVGVNPDGKTVEEKVKLLREYREKQYETLLDVVYKRKGWTKNGVPTIERLKELGIDLPELVEIVKDAQE